MMFHGIDSEFNAVVEMKFLKHRSNVIPDCFFAQIQQVTNLRICLAARHMGQNIHFAIREITERILFGFPVKLADA